MLDAVIFNFITGNHDAYGKNFSLLYTTSEDGQIARLAPLCDLICTAAYPDLSKTMARCIGGKYKSESIKSQHFERMAQDAGLARPLVLQHVSTLSTAVLDQLNNTELLPVPTPKVINIILRNAQKIKNQQMIGPKTP
jgi:serine/threonine-protein kinase HipA